jgi:NADPH:quinone reductase-like Zn-dependent oxidoreductase
VFQGVHLRPGETLLVHGGSSGIGTMAIQLGKVIGARVAVTAGSAEKLEACGALGADALIYLDRNIDALAVNGRLVVIGMQGGAKAELNLGTLMAKRAAIVSTSLRARPLDEKAAIVAAVREHVWPLLENDRVRPVIDRVVPLADAAEAHRLMESSTHIGKILLRT